MSGSLKHFVALATLTVMCSGLSIPAADAAGGIRFGRIQYDSPGSDTRSNASLNGEYFVLKNTSPQRVNLKGFSVRDKSNNVYNFTTVFNLGAGKAVKVHTGKGTNTSSDRYWGRSSYVWNNSSDAGYLRNARKIQVDACGWTSVGRGYKLC